MATLWSGRFTAEPDAETFDYGRSLPVDRRLIEDDIAGSLAWAEALAGAGVIAGLGGAAAVGRLLRSVSFGVSALDAAVLLLLAAAVVLTTLLAVWIPARHAARQDPARVLRTE